MDMDRRNFIRMSLLATGGATLGVSLFGCAPGATTGGKASLRMAQFGSESRMKLLQQALAAYTARNPERSITIDPASNEVYTDKLATQVSGGNAPDLMGLYHNVVARFARQNALLNLDDHIGKGLDISAFQDGIVDLGKIGGNVRALSFGDNALGIMYDVDRLASVGKSLPEPGYTWEDLLTFSVDISRAVGGNFYGTEDRSRQLDQAFRVWLLQRGKYTFTQDAEIGFSKSDLTDWLEYWQLMRDGGAAPPAAITAEAGGTFDQSALIHGYAANHQTYANAISSMQTLTTSRLELTTLPIDPHGKGSGHSVRGSNWVGVYSRTKNPEVAVDVLNFLFNDEEAVGILGAELGAPPNRKLRAGLKYTEPNQLFIDYMALIADKLGVPAITLDQEFPPGWADIDLAFNTAADNVSFGKATVSESVDKFFTTAEAALKAAA